jgi:16S rRNA pseudouridine516 synthase
LIAVRLDYFISHSAGLSRKQVKILIGKGHVSVEGFAAVKANTQVVEHDKVWLDGRLVPFSNDRYIMLNKPSGLICSTDDPDHPTVMTLLATEDVHRLHIAGRLDLDTTGLILLTTDGQWSHQITSPNSECPKCYRVTLEHALTDEARKKLEEGVLLRGETEKTRPATVEVLAENMIHLTITQGKYHQVKRMLAAVENRVLALHRVSVGGVQLDAALAPGEYRLLSESEVALIGKSEISD